VGVVVEALCCCFSVLVLEWVDVCFVLVCSLGVDLSVLGLVDFLGFLDVFGFFGGLICLWCRLCRFICLSFVCVVFMLTVIYFLHGIWMIGHVEFV